MKILRDLLPLPLLLLVLAAACAPEPTPTEPSALEGETPPATPMESAPSPTPAEEEGGDDKACTDPYFPVALGASWTYQGTSGPEGAYTFTDAISDVRADGFTLTATFEGLTRTQEWTCTSEGLTAMQYPGAGVAGSVVTEDSTAEFQTTSFSGVSLPRDLTAGDTWTLTYEVTGAQTVPGGETAETKGTVTFDFEAIGDESVSVPAGAFEALRVDIEMNLNFTMSIGGAEVPMIMTTSGSTWFVRDVGWVKSVSSGTVFEQPVEETLELLSYTIP